MGRRTCTLMPTAEKLSDTKTKASNLAARKRLQCRQYNRGIKNLAPLKAGDAICMKLPGEKWSVGHSWPKVMQSWGGRMALPQKPPPGTVYFGVITGTKQPHWWASSGWEWKQTTGCTRVSTMTYQHPDPWDAQTFRESQTSPYLAWRLWPVSNTWTLTWKCL